MGGHGKEDANKIPASGSTPLVDATAAFLQEFVQDKRKARKIEVVSRNGVNGSSGSGRSGKGKEREIKEDRMEDDDWDGDSFLPGYVYDAMKAKKRFDNMRVCCFRAMGQFLSLIIHIPGWPSRGRRGILWILPRYS